MINNIEICTTFFDTRDIDVSSVINANNFKEAKERFEILVSNYVDKNEALKELDNCKNLTPTQRIGVYNLKDFGVRNGYYKGFRNLNSNIWLQKINTIDSTTLPQVKYTLLKIFKIIIKFTEKGTINMLVKVENQQLTLI